LKLQSTIGYLSATAGLLVRLSLERNEIEKRRFAYIRVCWMEVHSFQDA